MTTPFPTDPEQDRIDAQNREAQRRHDETVTASIRGTLSSEQQPLIPTQREHSDAARLRSYVAETLAGPVVVPPPWDPRVEAYDAWRDRWYPGGTSDPDPRRAGDYIDAWSMAREARARDSRTVDGYPPLTPQAVRPGPRVRDFMVCPPWVHGVVTLLVAGLWAPLWWLDYRHGRKALLRAVAARG